MLVGKRSEYSSRNISIREIFVTVIHYFNFVAGFICFIKQLLKQKLQPVIKKAKKQKIELLFCNAAHFVLSAFYAWDGLN
jgi:Kef-type K+ transport system membrane component KefB